MALRLTSATRRLKKKTSEATVTVLDVVEKEFLPLEESSRDQFSNDLLNMMQLNYPNPRSWSTISMMNYFDLRFCCYYGIVYGAIQTSCISCHGILCPSYMSCDAHTLRCLNRGRLKLDCRNDTYSNVVFSCWKIPEVFQHPNMKQVVDKIIITLSDKSINPTIPTNINLGIIEESLIRFLREGPIEIEAENYKIYEKSEDGVKKSYSYFSIHRPDLSDGKSSFSQILVRDSGDLTSTSDCWFYTCDVIYEKPKNGTQKMMLEDAIRWFEEKFNLNTGIDWLSWCQLCSGKKVEINRHCFYNNNYMLPLKIDYEHEKSILSKLKDGIPMVVEEILSNSLMY